MAAIILSILMTGCAGRPPADIGLTREDRLAPCPKSPNCVSSMASDEEHAIEPFIYEGVDKRKAYEALLNVLSTQARIEIVTRDENYLHVTFKSKIFRFRDDVEFYFPGDESIIHVRSASRVGYSDMGVNRKRVEKLRKEFDAAMK